MIISGFQKIDLINFPGKIAATVFLQGCNMKCPYCHNPSLVIGTNDEIHSEEEILRFLEKRRAFTEGFVISGGEPTIHKELPDFIQKIKKLGFPVKLDTNGTNPQMLKTLIDARLVNYIAMDIKAPFEKYNLFFASKCSQTDVSKLVENVKQSMKILQTSVCEIPDFFAEFRTTCPKSILTESDFTEIAREIADCRDKTAEKLKCKKPIAWYLQPFNPNITLDEKMHNVQTYTETELTNLADALVSLVPTVRVRK